MKFFPLFTAAWLIGLSLLIAAPLPQVLHLGNGGEPTDLDPLLITGMPEYRLSWALFEPLVGKHPETLAPIPAIAESWSVSPDGKTYTFRLRKNAKWSNGEPVTASDFVYSWRRLVDPKTASPSAQNGYCLRNGRALNTGKLKDLTKLGVKAVNPTTLVAHLESRTPFFLSLLFHPSFRPVHRKTIETYKSAWTRPENIVSNGAFMLREWTLNKIIIMIKNPHYWNASQVRLAEVHFHPVAVNDTEEKMFRAKQIHVTSTVPIEKVPYWQQEPSHVYQQSPYLGSYFYYFNVTRPPFDKKGLRRALALAVDRDRLVRLVTRAGQQPGTVFTPPGIGGYQPTPRLPEKGDLDRAKAELRSAGFLDGNSVPVTQISYNTNEGHKKIAETIQNMWKENLGVRVELLNHEWKVQQVNQQSHNFQISRGGWIADYNDPVAFLGMFETGSPMNFSGWSNKKYDRLLHKATKEGVESLRFALLREAEDILLEELPILPLYIYTRIYLKSAQVRGWYSNLEDIHPLQSVYLE